MIAFADAVERRLIRPAGRLGAVALILLAFVVGADVLVRSLGLAVAGGVEVSEVLLVVLVFLSLAQAQSLGHHIGIETVVVRFPAFTRSLAHLISLLVCGALTTLLFYGTTLAAFESYATGEFQFGTLRFPLWPSKAVVATGFGLLLIELFLQFIVGLVRLAGGDYAGVVNMGREFEPAADPRHD